MSSGFWDYSSAARLTAKTAAFCCCLSNGVSLRLRGVQPFFQPAGIAAA
jgi:hypothetical protein